MGLEGTSEDTRLLDSRCRRLEGSALRRASIGKWLGMALKRKPIVVVGSVNIDLVTRAERIPIIGETVLSSDFQMHPGGKGANQAVAVARLGYPVRMIASVGSDAFGEELRAQLVRSGVDTRAVQTRTGPSGVAVIAVAPNGDNAIVVTPRANATVSAKDIDDN